SAFILARSASTADLSPALRSARSLARSSRVCFTSALTAARSCLTCPLGACASATPANATSTTAAIVFSFMSPSSLVKRKARRVPGFSRAARLLLVFGFLVVGLHLALGLGLRFAFVLLGHPLLRGLGRFLRGRRRRRRRVLGLREGHRAEGQRDCDCD